MAVSSVTEGVIQVLSREIDLLKDSNRIVRKSALQKIRTIIKDDIISNGQSFQEVGLIIFKPLLVILSDPVERCRELCAEILLEITTKADRPCDILASIIPVFMSRLSLPELVETSEEIRLLEVRILENLIRRSKTSELAPFLNDFVAILSRTLTDTYSEIRKTSCSCAIILANVLPDHFHLQGESLVNPLLLSLTHQHTKVRCACIQAIGVIVEYGNNQLVDSVVPHLAQRLFDQSPLVRTAVVSVCGRWLMELKDRYIHAHKILPLLLTCLCDEVMDVHDLALSMWDEVGEKYLIENEDQARDLIDFPKPSPDHYPPQVPRPSFGCRFMVQRHLGQILPAVFNDLKDWVGATRSKAISLLYQLLLHAEEKATRYLERVMAALVRHANDQEREVVFMVEQCCELLGYFIRPDAWCDVFLPEVQQQPNSGHLLCLAGMLRRSNRVEMTDYLSPVAKLLAEPSLCRNAQPLSLYYLVNCVDSLIVSCGDLCASVGQSLFIVLVTADALAESELQITVKVAQCLAQLEDTHNLAEGLSLYDIYSRPFLEQLTINHSSWALQSLERVIFNSLLLSSGEANGENLDLIIPIFVSGLQPKKDPQMRLKLLTLLSTLLFKADETLNARAKLPAYVPELLSGVLLPNLEWHAGCTAAALRSAAVSCLWAMAKGLDLDQQLISPFSRELCAQLTNLLEDDSQMTRLMTCKVLIQVLPSLMPSIEKSLSTNLGNTVINRMDDVSDDIRVVVTKVLSTYYLCASGLDWNPNTDHWREVYQRLLIHMDDAQPRVREAVLDLLKKIMHLSPNILLEQAKQACLRHRTPECCDDLVEHIQTLNLSNSH